MAAATTINPADVAYRQYAAVFSPMLHKGVEFQLVLASYATPWKYEENLGTETMRYFRKRKASGANVETIAAGAGEMTGPVGRVEMATGYKDMPLAMKAAGSQVSTRQRAIDIFNTVKEYSETLAGDAKLHVDSVARDSIIDDSFSAAVNGSAIGKRDLFNRFAGITNTAATGNSTARFALFHAGAPAATKFTRLAHLAMLSHLADQKVPKRNGTYVCALPPLIYGDLRNDGTVVDAMTGNDAAKLWKGGLSYLDGAPIVQHDNPRTLGGLWAAADQGSAGDKYGVIYLGADAIQAPSLVPNKANISDYRSPKMTVLAGPDKTDPHNLYTYIGFTLWFSVQTTLTNEADDVPHYGVLWCRSVVAEN